MENERQETLAQNNNVMPEGVFLDFFKYPYASYLSGMMFKLIQESLQSKNYLLQAEKKAENLNDQYAFLYTLRILNANFAALQGCQLSLSDLLEEEEYQSFLETYRGSIVALINEGYSKNFSKENE